MLNEYAKREARDFIFSDETELADDYPVHYGYCYLAVFEDGEVRVVSSDVAGTVATLRVDLGRRFVGRTVAEIRRCDIVARMFSGGGE